jgi:hypothetical protein
MGPESIRAALNESATALRVIPVIACLTIAFLKILPQVEGIALLTHIDVFCFRAKTDRPGG